MSHLRASLPRFVLLAALATSPLLAAEELPNATVAEARSELAALFAQVDALARGFTAPEDRADKEWVKKRLAHLVEVDQAIRKAMSNPKLGSWDAAARQTFLDGVTARMADWDAATTAELKGLLAVHRWFTVSEFGKEADKNAWLLVQHADRDLAFQKQVLEVLTGLYPTGETNPSNYAYLWDRVAVNSGELQRYGTQGKCAEVGRWEPHPVEAPTEDLEKRRSAVGLQTMAEYRELFKQYGLCQTADPPK